MATITFRNSKIVYYGPHSCENCGAFICKAGFEWGGTAFTYPSGPIYPNTEWFPHICDPRDVTDRIKPEPFPHLPESCSQPENPNDAHLLPLRHKLASVQTLL